MTGISAIGDEIIPESSTELVPENMFQMKSRLIVTETNSNELIEPDNRVHIKHEDNTQIVEFENCPQFKPELKTNVDLERITRPTDYIKVGDGKEETTATDIDQQPLVEVKHEIDNTSTVYRTSDLMGKLPIPIPSLSLTEIINRQAAKYNINKQCIAMLNKHFTLSTSTFTYTSSSTSKQSSICTSTSISNTKTNSSSNCISHTVSSGGDSNVELKRLLAKQEIQQNMQFSNETRTTELRNHNDKLVAKKESTTDYNLDIDVKQGFRINDQLTATTKPNELNQRQQICDLQIKHQKESLLVREKQAVEALLSLDQIPQKNKDRGEDEMKTSDTYYNNNGYNVMNIRMYKYVSIDNIYIII